MAVGIELKDGTGSGSRAKVTPRGQVVTAPLDFSSTHFNLLSVNGQAFNFIKPVPNKCFIITDIIISADKNVGTGGVLVELYETDSLTGTVATRNILAVQLARNAALSINNLNILSNIGVWLNAKMDDNNVYMTIAGYFVDTVDEVTVNEPA